MKTPSRPLLTAATGLVILALAAGLVNRWRIARDFEHPLPATPDAALEELRDGNARFVGSHRMLSVDTAHDAEHRARLAQGQHPFAAVLCCSDSRVCPEFIFDQRTGAIFEIRNAGNVVYDDVMGSIEYAVEHLHIPLVVVLGHTRCGAIEAVHTAADRPLHAHLRALQEHMKGTHDHGVKSHGRHAHAELDALSRQNAREQAQVLVRDSEPIRDAVARGRVKLMVGIYDVQTGVVEFFDP